MQIQFNENYRGVKLQYIGSESPTLYYFNSTINNAYAIIYPSNSIFTLTGYYVLNPYFNYYFYQTVEGGMFWLEMYADRWANIGKVVLTIPVDFEIKNVDYLNGTLANNARIYENQLFCAFAAIKLAGRGKLTQKEFNTLSTLQTRLEERNNTVLTSGFATNIQESYPEGYINLKQYLKDFSKIDISKLPNIGSLTGYIIVAAVTIVAMATVAYFLWKKLYDESKQDVKFSDDLTKVLKSKLTEEEWNQLVKETAGMITKTKINEKVKSVGNMTATLAVAGILALLFILKPTGRNE